MSSPDIQYVGMTLGAMYVGAMVAAILFGITNLQTVIYYKKYPGDWWVYRYSVASLWILDALHVASSTHALYQYLITLYGNFFATYDVIWSFKLQVLITVLIVMDVQALYTVRLWKLNRSLYKVVPWIGVLSMTAAFIYINSSLAMLNARKSQKSQTGESNVPRVPRFPHKTCPGDPREPGVDIVLSETPTLDHTNEACDFEV
ncbi:hypothetical protein IW261DRAFT_1660107 [Armillaria novae-zelandiae]|uniref:Uncharacterized protein n=1 Tax=Armillaria novae-zelandiae TaxID=153914 RepID=A0AA39NW46_9AGAR|nr:hypothetical protein IW261DRAFT_1660107 [Armillaria novae-zelandiae]